MFERSLLRSGPEGADGLQERCRDPALEEFLDFVLEDLQDMVENLQDMVELVLEDVLAHDGLASAAKVGRSRRRQSQDPVRKSGVFELLVFQMSSEAVEEDRTVIDFTLVLQNLPMWSDVLDRVVVALAAVPGDLLAKKGTLDQVQLLHASAVDDAIDCQLPLMHRAGSRLFQQHWFWNL